MKTKSGNLTDTGTKRRDFLKMTALSAPAAVAAAGAIGTTEAEAANEVGSEKMADTAHTRAYYDSARF